MLHFQISVICIFKTLALLDVYEWSVIASVRPSIRLSFSWSVQGSLHTSLTHSLIWSRCRYFLVFCQGGIKAAATALRGYIYGKSVWSAGYVNYL